MPATKEEALAEYQAAVADVEAEHAFQRDNGRGFIAREAAAKARQAASDAENEVRRRARDAAATLKRDKAELWLAYRRACKAIDATPIPPRWPSREELAQRSDVELRRQLTERAAADEEARAARQAEIDRYNASLLLE